MAARPARAAGTDRRFPRTDLAFEVVDALTGASFERAFQRFRAHPEGGRLLDERPDLLATLMDREALAALPEGSFGRAYLAFMQSADLNAAGLAAAQATAMQRRGEVRRLDPDREFFSQRGRDMHDLWQVLTGYGMDEAGEAALLAFNLGQFFNAGIAFIVLAAVAIGPRDRSLSWPRYLWRAYRRGRRATRLSAVRYEELLAQPLGDVRLRLGIAPPNLAHARGVIVGNRVPGSNDWVITALAA
jgi:ubiquinone biosynthesis protein COQ4